MGNPELDVIVDELEVANDLLSKLDDSIKDLEEQYARMVIIVDAFEKVKAIHESEMLPLGSS